MRIDEQSLRRLWQEAFGDDDPFLDAFFSTAYSPRRCRTLHVSGQLAAALYWFDCSFQGQKIAYLYAVATVKAFRGRGLCRRLMEDTHRHLADLGYAGTLLVPGEASLFQMYTGLGYETVSGISEFSCTAAPGKLTLEQTSRDEYARLRRQLLPAGGVLQEGENLAFLETQYSFFKGAGCLLAASRRDENLFCAELLGDCSAAPGILAALGCQDGTFRTPGNTRPFAMYHAFTDAPAPSYFGLAFD